MCCEETVGSATTRFVRIQRFVCREEEEGKYIAFDGERNTGFIMNRSSHAIWELCDGKRDIEALKSELRQTYANGIPTDLDRVIVEHLAILKRVGLIEEHTE